MSLASLLLVLLLLAVIAAVAVLAAGGGDSFSTAPPDRSPHGALPAGELAGDDVDRLRFSLAFRGYRMDEVDDVLDRLSQELAWRERRIAELEARQPAADPQRRRDPPAPWSGV